MTQTPGPWKLRRKGGNIVEAGPFKYFASFDGIQSGDELAANARLIAAAPDMLAALKAVNKLVAEAAMTGFNWQDGDWAERLFESQQVTSRAISKAESK